MAWAAVPGFLWLSAAEMNFAVAVIVGELEDKFPPSAGQTAGGNAEPC